MSESTYVNTSDVQWFYKNNSWTISTGGNTADKLLLCRQESSQRERERDKGGKLIAVKWSRRHYQIHWDQLLSLEEASGRTLHPLIAECFLPSDILLINNDSTCSSNRLNQLFADDSEHELASFEWILPEMPLIL